MDGALQSQCVPGCIRCCDQEGFVYITESDLRNAAEFLRMTAAEFEAKYVYRTRHQLRLRKPRASQCHFLHAGGCGIHPVKPVQCRLFPFWPELVGDRKAWNRAAKYCPGIHTGDLIQIGNAIEAASEMKRAYPSHYK